MCSAHAPERLSDLRVRVPRLPRRIASSVSLRAPLGSIRIASSLPPTRLPLGFASSTSVARVLGRPASVATPRICKFHVCCARLVAHARLCNDPSDPCLLSTFYGAQRLLQPIRSMSAACVLWCPAFARVTSPTHSTQGPWNPLESRVPRLCGPPGIHQNRKFHIFRACPHSRSISAPLKVVLDFGLKWTQRATRRLQCFCLRLA